MSKGESKSGQEPSPVTAPEGEPVRVLLAEDNVIASELISMMAKRLGCRVDTVSNGLDAIDLIYRAQQLDKAYDLLLLDAMMPVLTGSETARRLRAEGIDSSQLPIIAVTAATDPAEVREYLRAGMQGYLSKPVSLAEFSACIDAWAPGRSKKPHRGRRTPSDALRRRYDLRKIEVLERFETAVTAGHLAPGIATELREHLHKLAGTAGSFGETDLSVAASQGESLLEGAAPDGLRGAISRSLDLLKAVA